MDMAGDDLHSEYEKLSEVARIFQTQANVIGDLIKQVTDGKRRLDQTWSGKGYNAFNAEIGSKVFPRLQKLQDRLSQACSLMNNIIQVLQSAEKQAANLFHF